MPVAGFAGSRNLIRESKVSVEQDSEVARRIDRVDNCGRVDLQRRVADF